MEGHFLRGLSKKEREALRSRIEVILTAVLAALGDFNVVWLALIAISASACGDSLGYVVGRTLGSRVLDWIERQRWYRATSSRSIARARAYFKRRGAWAIVMSRFLFSALGGTINVIAGADSYPYI
jgi:membrane-associated protein